MPDTAQHYVSEHIIMVKSSRLNFSEFLYEISFIRDLKELAPYFDKS